MLLTDEIMCKHVYRDMSVSYLDQHEKSTTPQNTKDICELLKQAPDLTGVSETEYCM